MKQSVSEKEIEMLTEGVLGMFGPFCALFESDLSHELFPYCENEIHEMQGIESQALSLNIKIYLVTFQAVHSCLTVFDGYLGLLKIAPEFLRVELKPECLKLPL